MSVQDASGRLEKAIRQLTGEWNHAKQSWSDVKMSSFEDRYIVPLQQDTRLATETMVRMSTLIDRIRRECSDREAF
jgi:hypothetical protein